MPYPIALPLGLGSSLLIGVRHIGFISYDGLTWCGASPMKNHHLPILIEMDEEGYYIVSCPMFKGCHTYGKSIEEAMENIREVIDICLEETGLEELNQFVGFRELELAANA